MGKSPEVRTECLCAPAHAAKKSTLSWGIAHSDAGAQRMASHGIIVKFSSRRELWRGRSGCTKSYTNTHTEEIGHHYWLAAAVFSVTGWLYSSRLQIQPCHWRKDWCWSLHVQRWLSLQRWRRFTHIVSEWIERELLMKQKRNFIAALG